MFGDGACGAFLSTNWSFGRPKNVLRVSVKWSKTDEFWAGGDQVRSDDPDSYLKSSEATEEAK